MVWSPTLEHDFEGSTFIFRKALRTNLSELHLNLLEASAATAHFRHPQGARAVPRTPENDALARREGPERAPAPGRRARGGPFSD